MCWSAGEAAQLAAVPLDLAYTHTVHHISVPSMHMMTSDTYSLVVNQLQS